VVCTCNIVVAISAMGGIISDEDLCNCLVLFSGMLVVVGRVVVGCVVVGCVVVGCVVVTAVVVKQLSANKVMSCC